MKFEEQYIQSQGLTLYLKSAKPRRPRGKILLLHGFPDYHETWQYQLEALGNKCHIAALELRGVNNSERPKKGKDYAVRSILPDISAAIEAMGGGPVHLIGHDWGNMIGWCYATDPHYSRNLLSYQGLSAPHPGTILTCVADKLKTLNPGPLGKQLLKSWYVWYFQIPLLPEFSIRRLSPEWRAGLLKKGGMDHSDPLIKKTKEEFAAITTGTVNLYRQLIRRRPPRPQAPTIPTQQIIPTGDLFVSVELYDGQNRVLAGPNYRALLVDGPHWIHRTSPETINAILLDFIENGSGPTGGESRDPATDRKKARSTPNSKKRTADRTTQKKSRSLGRAKKGSKKASNKRK